MPKSTVDFTLTVTLKNNVPDFNYTQNGLPVTGSVVANESEIIRYLLVDQTGKELKFIGAAFDTPFDNVIDNVNVSENGLELQLLDLDKTPGKTGFRFILSSIGSNLLISSPDPQVVNRGQD
ncbi:DP-EP family protein [Shewanella kaireitica]|uniref:DP-EP family protein n=1 Tax=Shewanella kaireitica TaxID=212021 RepID=UPI00200FB905|nr:DP-EP family protein [Shewanella kaireitica]MCL1093109.1 DP-EP family protein [Shewanella kaireitica]